MTKRERLLAVTISTAILGAVVTPIRQNWCKTPRDGFPLSYYPMFSRRRSGRTTVYCLIAETTTGERVRLSHKLVGTGGHNQTRKQINHMVRRGRAEELCRLAARKVSRRRDDIAAVHVIRGRYSLDHTFRAGELVGKETILHTVHCRPVGEQPA